MTKKGTWSYGSLEPTPLHWLERTDARYDKPSEDECWIWTGPVDKDGYGRTYAGKRNRKNKSMMAHRAMHELYIGQIPLNLTVDHLCRNRACGNPKHLRILTLMENSKDNGFATKTHCPHGHEYTVENTGYGKRKNGALQRKCRTCINKRAREYQAKLKTLSTTS